MRHIATLCFVIGFVISPVVAAAQGLGAIAGTARDTSGAVLPGVTVEATSPVLIEKVRPAVTDDSGQYTIVTKHDGREHIAAVSVPDGPAFVKDINVAVLPAAAAPALASAGAVRATTAERPAVSYTIRMSATPEMSMPARNTPGFFVRRLSTRCPP